MKTHQPLVDRGALKKGISLVEVLIVISIISVLVAILFPVYASAKRSAKVIRSKSNMHQIWAAVSLYREEYDNIQGPGDYLAGLGLPPGAHVLVRMNRLPKEVLHTGGVDFGVLGGDVYSWMPPVEDLANIFSLWRNHYANVGEHAIMQLDETQNPEARSKFATFDERRYLGMHLDGQLSDVRARGHAPSSYQFWESH